MFKNTCFALLALTVTALAGSPRIVAMPFSITATINIQTPATVSGEVATSPKPTQSKVTTKSLLTYLAKAEYYAGNWTSNSFPSRANLVWLNYTDDYYASHFVVTDSSGNQLCSVSNVLQFVSMNNYFFVVTGKHTTLSQPELLMNYQTTSCGRLIYDDTNFGGWLIIDLNGLAQTTINDVVSSDNLTYKESVTTKFTSCTGGGEIYGNGEYTELYFCLTGSCSASGSAVITF